MKFYIYEMTKWNWIFDSSFSNTDSVTKKMTWANRDEKKNWVMNKFWNECDLKIGIRCDFSRFFSSIRCCFYYSFVFVFNLSSNMITSDYSYQMSRQLNRKRKNILTKIQQKKVENRIFDSDQDYPTFPHFVYPRELNFLNASWCFEFNIRNSSKTN